MPKDDEISNSQPIASERASLANIEAEKLEIVQFVKDLLGDTANANGLGLSVIGAKIALVPRISDLIKKFRQPTGPGLRSILEASEYKFYISGQGSNAIVSIFPVASTETINPQNSGVNIENSHSSFEPKSQIPKFKYSIFSFFSRSIHSGEVRYILIDDANGQSTAIATQPETQVEGKRYVEILPSDIPDFDTDKERRKESIYSSIKHWCQRNNVKIDLLKGHDSSEPDGRNVQQVVSSGVQTSRPNSGYVAILGLIDIIPAVDRANFALPLNLIEKLLRS